MNKLISANSDLTLRTPAGIVAKWKPVAEVKGEDATIAIMDMIDRDFGVSAQSVHEALQAVGDGPVNVLINSPGGDAFEGIAIYNLLKSRGNVRVKILSMAASAASIVAMAGDEIEVMAGAQIMVHNAWAFAIGNKHDMRQAAETLDKFDAQMNAIYAERSGRTVDEVAALLDAETWMGGDEAVALGFATTTSAEKAKQEPSARLVALRTIETALQASGLSRSERREIVKELTGTPSAAVQDVTPSADSLKETAALAANLQNIFGVIP